MYLFGLNLLPCINRRYSNTILYSGWFFTVHMHFLYFHENTNVILQKRTTWSVFFFFRVDIKSVYFWIVNYFNTDWQNMWPKTQNVNEVEENFVWIKSSPGGATASASIPRSSHVRIQNYFRGRALFAKRGAGLFWYICCCVHLKTSSLKFPGWLCDSHHQRTGARGISRLPLLNNSTLTGVGKFPLIPKISIRYCYRPTQRMLKTPLIQMVSLFSYFLLENANILKLNILLKNPLILIPSELVMFNLIPLSMKIERLLNGAYPEVSWYAAVLSS